MNENRDRQEILAVLDNYVRAVGDPDAALFEGLFWADDSRFSEVENMIPKPFGKEQFDDIRGWLRQRCESGKRGLKQRFYDTEMYMLAPGVAYAVTMRDEYEDGKPVPSRVTLVLLKKGYEWRIIHGHFSYVPEG